MYFPLLASFALITLAMCAAYFVIVALFPPFFGQKRPPLGARSLFSLACIAVSFAAFFAAGAFIPDPALGNRVLHMFGGGVTAFLVCFLAARDSGVAISKFQFFVFSALLVLALGIGNELFELLMHEYGGYVMTASVTDTWLDLASNVTGVIVAGICLVPFFKKAPVVSPVQFDQIRVATSFSIHEAEGI